MALSKSASVAKRSYSELPDATVSHAIYMLLHGPSIIITFRPMFLLMLSMLVLTINYGANVSNMSRKDGRETIPPPGGSEPT